jgi:hypothetical protein
MCEEYKKMIENVLDASVRRRTRLPANGLGGFQKRLYCNTKPVFKNWLEFSVSPSDYD